MFRTLLLVLALCITGQPAMALTKAEALVCVNKGIAAFLAGKKISHLVDVPYMMERDKIHASEDTVKHLLDQGARENLGYYRNVSANVVGKPQAKKKGFFLVAGTVRGEETKSLKEVAWKPFSYQYTLWIRLDGDQCRIGVIAIEEVFRLAGWVKTKLGQNS